MPERVNNKFVADLLCMDIAEVKKLSANGVFKRSRGGFEISQVVQGYIKHLRSQIPKRNFLRTMQDVADHVGKEFKTIQRLKTDNGYRKEKDGYDIDEAIRLLGIRAENQLAKTKSGVQEIVGGVENGDGTLREHEIRLKKAKANREEIKEAEDRGRLVDVALVRQEQISRELAFKKTFMSLPRTMSALLVGRGVREIEATLVKYVSEGFRKLVKHGNRP